MIYPESLRVIVEEYEQSTRVKDYTDKLLGIVISATVVRTSPEPYEILYTLDLTNMDVLRNNI